MHLLVTDAIRYAIQGLRMREFDYIIVGAGTAGCVIANRISANPDVSVLVIEAGPRDSNPNIHRPAGLFRLLGGSLTSNHRTVPQANLNGRELPFVQGRVLGGGSSVNGQVFTRGVRRITTNGFVTSGVPAGVSPMSCRISGNRKGTTRLPTNSTAPKAPREFRPCRLIH